MSAVATVSNTMHTRSALLCATAVLACSTLAACGGDDRNARPTGGALAPTPAPSPTPTPTPPPQYTATPVPFNLTQSRTFDILGWDSWPSAPTPSTIQFRWNAAIGKYEVLAPGYADWSRLEALQDLRFGGPPHDYDVFGSGGTKLPFYMIVWAPPHRSAGGWIRRQCPHLRKLFRACLLRLRNSDGAGRRSRQRNDDLQLRRGRDRRGTADLRSCCRNRVRLGGAVLGWGCPIPAGSDELRPGRHDLCRHVRDRWGPGRPLLRPTGGQRRGPGKGRRPRLRSREWNHDRGVRGMREHSGRSGGPRHQ